MRTGRSTGGPYPRHFSRATGVTPIRDLSVDDLTRCAFRAPRIPSNAELRVGYCGLRVGHWFEAQACTVCNASAGVRRLHSVPRKRDLFGAIVLSGAALTAGCTARQVPTAQTAGGERPGVAEANTNEEAALTDAGIARGPAGNPPSNQDAAPRRYRPFSFCV